MPKTSSQPSKALKRTGGGQFKREDKYVYFFASNPIVLSKVADIHPHLLIAVNELRSESDTNTVEGILARGNPVFLDSGVFNLANEYAHEKGITHDEALRTPLNELTGFQELYDKYCSLVRKYESNLWGYVEIDLGGRDQKRETRAKLEAQGLRPIPVYHPLNDGWDYFDELASQYDRICVGNIVQASRYVRLRIMATIWERKQKYPHLWVHLLGMTPNEWAGAYPVESMDSSSWLVGVRWAPSWTEKANGARVENFSRKMFYELGDEVSHTACLRLGAVQFAMNKDNWRQTVPKPR